MKNTGRAFFLWVLVGCGQANLGHDDMVPIGTPLELTPEPRVTLGVVEGAKEQMFHEVSTPFLLRDGSVVVPSAGDHEIRVFDRSGTLVRRLGRQGRGPGEFERVGPAWAHGDTIEVFDIALQRITRFPPNGEPQAIQLRGTQLLWALGRVPGGWLLVNLAEPGLMRENPRDQIVVQRFDREGVHHLDVAQIEGVRRVRLLGRMTADLFSPTARFRVLDGHLYVADTTEPEVRVLDEDGQRVRSVRWTVETPVAPRAGLEQVRETLRDGRDIDQQLTNLLGAPLPDGLPAFTDMLVDELGFVWVRPYLPSRDAVAVGGNVAFHRNSTGGDWHILSPDGVRVGTVAMPTNFEPYSISTDALIGIVRDQLGVEFVHVYDLRRQIQDS